MGTCEPNAERWLDHLYGLLDEQESRELADHVAQCPACQATLAAAQRDRQRLARAAGWFRNIPEFTEPAEEQADGAQPAHPEAPAATLPLRSHVRRSLAQRLWPIWVAAAALLLAIFGGAEWHRRGSADHDKAVAAARKALQSIDVQFVELKSRAGIEERALWTGAKQGVMQIAVVGPTQYDPSAPYACRIATTDLDGQPLDAKLEVRLVRADSGEVVHRQAVTSHGDVNVLVPIGQKLAQGLRLEVAAKRGTDEVEVRETIQAAPATHLVHLVLNKSIYQHGEVIFFRALALDRSSLKPPAGPLGLTFTLSHADGKTKLKVPGTVGADGIATGEFAVNGKLPAGAYAIQVAAADPKAAILAHPRQLEVVEQLGNFEIRPDRIVYRPGETVELQVTNLRGADGKPIGNALVTAKSDIKNGPGSFMPGAFGRTDASGQARIKFAVPPTFEGSRITLNVTSKDPANPAKELKATRTIQVAPRRLEIDFYPEGGDLIAGVSQRVFYRVRLPSGETAAPGGEFTLRSSKGVVAQSKDSVGSFTFTPDAAETYVLQGAPGSALAEDRSPFRNLPIKKDGVSLHVPNSVASSGTAVQLQIRQAGGDRALLAVATCRGQIVGQQMLDAKAAQCELKLLAATRGIVRVTIYEVRDQRLLPMVERLVYRIPAERMDVKTAATNIEPGKTATVGIEARDEQGKPASAWALAVVVEDRYRAEINERSLAGHFLLASEFGADLADAPLLADDSEPTRMALENFLGTRGWRRFVAPAQGEPDRFATGKTAPALFSAVAPDHRQARALAIAKTESGLKSLQERVTRERAELEGQREIAAAGLTAAQTARGDHQRMPWEYFRLGLGILAVLAFLAGLAGMLFGLARFARRRAATTAFAVAFGGLGLCLALYVSTTSMTPIHHVKGGGAEIAGSQPLPQVTVAFNPDKAALAPAGLAGQVALVADPKVADPTAPRHGLDWSHALVMNAGGVAVPGASFAAFVKHPQLVQRFEAAEKMLQTPMQVVPGYGREFAIQQPGADSHPTLLWHPNVKLDNGQARVAFDVPSASASYRVLIYAHSADGRLGFAESRVEVKAK